MKKYFLFLIVLFSPSFLCNASTYKFIWDESTTTIEVPLGNSIQNYLSIPKAYLYVDGKKVDDAKINYNSTGDWLFLLTDVDTTKVGDYQVWYKAIETKYKPGQCQGYKALITFKVVDLENPVFISYPEKISCLLGNKKTDYLSLVTAKDNSNICNLTYDDSLVNYNKPGEYKIYIYASDGYNISSIEIPLLIEDPDGPVVSFLGENNKIRLAINEKVSLVSYFKAIDKTDGDVTSSIYYADFDTSYERSFLLPVSFKDSSGNITTVDVTIEIVDENTPVIELFSNTLVIDYKEDFKKLIKENIKEAYLGSKNIINSISIDYSSIKNEVGSYVVTYSYKDDKHDYQKECAVKLLSSNPPIIIVENIELILGSAKPNYSDYFVIIDDSQAVESINTEIDDSLVNYSKEGVYPVRISAINSSGLNTEETLYITITSKKEEINNSINFNYLFIGLVAIIGIGIGGFIYYKKRKNCNN